MAGGDLGGRRAVQHGRPDRLSGVVAPRHAPDEPRSLTRSRTAYGTRAGGHLLARLAGRAGPARSVGQHHAELQQFHRRRFGIGELPRPVCRQRPDRELRAGAATDWRGRIGAGTRSFVRGVPRGCAAAMADSA